MGTPSAMNFRLDAEERALLDRLAAELACSRADVVRWGIAALRGLLRDGLDGSTTREFFSDDRRVIVLQGARGRSLTLAERRNGSFFAGGWSNPAEWGEGPTSDEASDE